MADPGTGSAALPPPNECSRGANRYSPEQLSAYRSHAAEAAAAADAAVVYAIADRTISSSSAMPNGFFNSGAPAPTAAVIADVSE